MSLQRTSKIYHTQLQLSPKTFSKSKLSWLKIMIARFFYHRVLKCGAPEINLRMNLQSSYLTNSLGTVRF